MNFRVFIATLDSAFRLGSDNIGIGVDLNVENFLGLDSSDRAFRLDAGYRFGSSRRHAVDFSWFRFNREGQNTLTEDVEIPPELGGGTIPTGVTISSIFNFDIIKTKYNYSLLMDDRVNIKLGGGLYVMPIEFGLGRLGQDRAEESITAPLPVFGLGFDVAITPKWIFKSGLDIFYIKIDDFEGSILDVQASLEYRAWKHIAIGGGVEALDVGLEVTEDTSWPGLSFVGNVQFTYFGAQLYLKLYFSQQ